jgi:DNA-binding NarL/FixJ family response regulator
MIDVLIADDDELVRAGLRLILEETSDIKVTAEASDGRRAIDTALHEHPDIVLMDIRMPVMNGLDATQRITSATDGPRVIILTTFERDPYIFEGLKAGASGFLLKRSTPEQLIEAVRTVAAGDALLSPSVTRRLIDAYARSSSPGGLRDRRLEQLTEREREVLVQLARGLSNEQLAEELFISDNTVKTHIKRIFTKLNARDRAQAVVIAYETGLMNE